MIEENETPNNVNALEVNLRTLAKAYDTLQHRYNMLDKLNQRYLKIIERLSHALGGNE